MSFIKDTFNALTGKSAEKASNSAAAKHLLTPKSEARRLLPLLPGMGLIT